MAKGKLKLSTCKTTRMEFYLATPTAHLAVSILPQFSNEFQHAKLQLHVETAFRSSFFRALSLCFESAHFEFYAEPLDNFAISSAAEAYFSMCRSSSNMRFSSRSICPLYSSRRPWSLASWRIFISTRRCSAFSTASIALFISHAIFCGEVLRSLVEQFFVSSSSLSEECSRSLCALVLSIDMSLISLLAARRPSFLAWPFAFEAFYSALKFPISVTRSCHNCSNTPHFSAPQMILLFHCRPVWTWVWEA